MNPKKVLWVITHLPTMFDIRTLFNLINCSKAYRKTIISASSPQILYFVLRNGRLRSRKWFKQWLIRHKPIIDPEIVKALDQTYKASKNLLLNYQFKEGTKHWDVGVDIKIENKAEYKLFPKLKKVQYVAVGSYEMNSINQSVKLPKIEFKYQIQVGAYFARRFDCDCQATFAAEALNDKNEVVETLKKVIAVGELKGYDPHKQTCPYMFVCGTLGAYACSVKISISTKDSKYWAGNYAARISHPFVRITPK